MPFPLNLGYQRPLSQNGGGEGKDRERKGGKETTDQGGLLELYAHWFVDITPYLPQQP